MKLIDKLVSWFKPKSPFVIGEKYLFFNKSLNQLGRVTNVTKEFITIENATTVVMVGGIHEALTTGKIASWESNPPTAKTIFPICEIKWATQWLHDFPQFGTEQLEKKQKK